MLENSNNSEIEKKFTLFLETKGCRKTPERFAILKEVLEIDPHFDVEVLYKRLESTSYPVSKTTIYNNLELLVECGILRKHVFTDHAQYEMIDAAKAQHIHLICNVCGKIKDAKDLDLMRYLNSKKYSAFNTEYIGLYIYGTCTACARRTRKVHTAKASAEEKKPTKSKLEKKEPKKGKK